MKAVKKNPKAEIEAIIESISAWKIKKAEALIKRILAFEKEHPEWTGRKYNGDRILKSAELKFVKNMFSQASSIPKKLMVFAKSLNPIEKRRFGDFNPNVVLPDFVITPETTLGNALDAFGRLCDALCKLRNPPRKIDDNSQMPPAGYISKKVVMNNYDISEATLLRRRKDNKVHYWQNPKAADNSEFWYCEEDIRRERPKPKPISGALRVPKTTD